MITWRRVLLTISKRDRLMMMKKFEAIEEIHELDQVQEVWSRNKTPVFMCGHRESSRLNKTVDYDVVEVPLYPYQQFVHDFTNWAHSVGFECGEYLTGERFPVDQSECVFCKILEEVRGYPSTLDYNIRTKKEMNLILYESEHFIVLPERGSLKPGYVMVIPKDHQYFSAAQLPEELLDEYREVCEDVEEILKGAFDGEVVIFFEHGSSKKGYTSHPKSIVHAHVHVVVDFLLAQKYLDMVQMKPIDDMYDAANTHYFAYKVGANGDKLISMDPAVYVQRQYPRQVMACEFDFKPEMYNWRHYDFDEFISSTLYKVHDYLNTHGVSERISERTECFVLAYHQRSHKPKKD